MGKKILWVSGRVSGGEWRYFLGGGDFGTVFTGDGCEWEWVEVSFKWVGVGGQFLLGVGCDGWGWVKVYFG